jgi:SAM-dependent methyltransferase
MAEVDLEALARGYEHRPSSVAAAARAAQAVEGLVPGSWALDVGGGRGDHAAVWATGGFRSLVVDPSAGMNQAAADRQGVSVVRGRGESLPFADQSLSLVYYHLSIHYGDWRASLREAHRVLEPGGRCVIWTLGPRHHHASMLARWFPSVTELDEARFPDPRDLKSHLASLGATVAAGELTEVVQRRASSWQEAVRAGFVSTLQLIGEPELDEGLAAFRQAHPDPDEQVSYEMRWDWITTVAP